jgi:glycyl-tRNA synthetase beta chain
MSDFLLEIGCEEIPSDDMPLALDWNYPQGAGLANAASLLFDQNKVGWKRIQSFGTLRRLVLCVSGIESVVREEVEGPPVAIAFDPQGAPTDAAKGFAKRQGVPVAKLKRKKGPRGERLILEREIPVTKILEGIVPQILQRISFPKTMRWDDSGVRFVRPIRRVTWKVTKSAGSTFSSLKRLGAQLEEGRIFTKKEDGTVEALPLVPKKREALREKLKAAAHDAGGKLPDETTEEFEWLLNTLTFLSENPVVAVGSFRKEYLDLPSEVLATAMAKHLKLMSVFSEGGRALLPKFLAVLEGRPRNCPAVLANYERILEARFSDARFFYREDIRTPLSKKVPQLAKVVFHERMGTVAQRLPRLEQLMAAIAKEIGLKDSLTRLIPRTAQLAKADLVTQMVREFPSLQGTIGRYYARQDGEPLEIVEALAEQYKPRAASDPLPRTPLGCLLGLADRWDALIGFFGAGLKPTGSLDPYGLRRQAMGLVRILLSPPQGISFVGLSVDTVLEAGIQSWDFKSPIDRPTLRRELRAFLRERFEWLSHVVHKKDRPIIDAVLATGEDDLAGAWERLKVLQELWQDPREKKFLITAGKVVERTGRIVASAKKEVPDAPVDPSKFTSPEEKDLWNKWSVVKATTGEWFEKHDIPKATSAYGEIYPTLHNFFEKVMVMDPNPEIRRNRLAMMNEICLLYVNAAGDISKLPLPKEIESR